MTVDGNFCILHVYSKTTGAFIPHYSFQENREHLGVLALESLNNLLKEIIRRDPTPKYLQTVLKVISAGIVPLYCFRCIPSLSFLFPLSQNHTLCIQRKFKERDRNTLEARY